MNCSNSDYINLGIYIQRGVRKISGGDIVEYLFEYPLNIMDRNNYCIDSRGVDSFYQILSNNDGYKLNRFDRVGKYIEVMDISLEEINKGYIKLDDFLKSARYVGRKFIRTCPLITCYGNNFDKYMIKDNAYMNVGSFEYVVLYRLDNIFLVMCISPYFKEYKLIGCNYLIDNNYEFYGNVYDGYDDREKIYFEIVKQIDEFKMETVNTRVRKR